MVIYKIRIRQKAFEIAECNNLVSRCEQYLGEVSTMHTAQYTVYPPPPCRNTSGRGTLLHGGYLYLFFSSKMEQTLHSPSYGSQKSPHKEKI